MIDENKLKSKIEELKSKLIHGARACIQSLGRYLLKYRKKEEPVSKDLEKAAKHYLYSNILYDDVYVGNPTEKDCIEMFEAGAKWQKEKDLKLKLPTEISAIVERIAHDSGYTFEQSFAVLSAAKKAYEQGKSDMKQQMMKDAIETTLSKGLEEDYNIKGKYKAYIIVIKED